MNNLLCFLHTIFSLRMARTGRNTWHNKYQNLVVLTVLLIYDVDLKGFHVVSLNYTY